MERQMRQVPDTEGHAHKQDAKHPYTSEGLPLYKQWHDIRDTYGVTVCLRVFAEPWRYECDTSWWVSVDGHAPNTQVSKLSGYVLFHLLLLIDYKLLQDFSALFSDYTALLSFSRARCQIIVVPYSLRIQWCDNFVFLPCLIAQCNRSRYRHQTIYLSAYI